MICEVIWLICVFVCVCACVWSMLKWWHYNMAETAKCMLSCIVCCRVVWLLWLAIVIDQFFLNHRLGSTCFLHSLQISYCFIKEMNKNITLVSFIFKRMLDHLTELTALPSSLLEMLREKKSASPPPFSGMVGICEIREVHKKQNLPPPPPQNKFAKIEGENQSEKIWNF